MGMVPMLHVFDGYDLPDVDTRTLTASNQTWPLLDRLRAQAPAPHVRIRRLATMLAREFPDDPPNAPRDAEVWEDGQAPIAALCDRSAWSAFLGPAGFEPVMPRVVTLARELLLDVVDDHFQVYLPSRGRPQPQDEGTEYLRSMLDPKARRPWADSAALSLALRDGLLRVLGVSGFQPVIHSGDDPVRFERHLPSALQTVTAAISGGEKAQRCRILLEHRVKSPDGATTPVNTTLDALRCEHEPGWLHERTGQPFITLALTAFWVDWMLEDLAQWGLPWLHEAAGTVDLGRRGATSPAHPSQPTALELSLMPTAADAAARDPVADLKRRAQAGDLSAMLELAGAYLQGKDVERDPKAAADLMEKAAGMGSEVGMYNLAVCYQEGNGRPEDWDQALLWFGRAAEKGHARAIFVLAQVYRKGIGVPQDIAASNALASIAIAKGVSEAAKLGIVAGAGPWAELGKQLLEPGQMMNVLRSRHAGAGTLGRARPRPAGSEPAAASAPVHDRWGLLAAGLGALGWVALLVAAKLAANPTWWVTAQTWLVMAGAFGVYRLSGLLGHRGLVRLVLTVLALVPGLGTLVCAAQLWRSLKRR